MARLERVTVHNIEVLHVLCTGGETEFARAKEVREAWLWEMFDRGLSGWVAYEGKTPVIEWQSGSRRWSKAIRAES